MPYLFLGNGLRTPHEHKQGIAAHEDGHWQQDHGDDLHQIICCLQQEYQLAAVKHCGLPTSVRTWWIHSFKRLHGSTAGHLWHNACLTWHEQRCSVTGPAPRQAALR